MNNFTFYSPTKFVFGKEMEAQAGALVKEFGGSKVLLHFGGKSAEKSGLLGRVRESLKGAGLEFLMDIRKGHRFHGAGDADLGQLLGDHIRGFHAYVIIRFLIDIKTKMQIG